MSNRVTFRSRTTAAVLFSALLLAGCGDDGPTGPSEDFDLVGGSWQWRVTNASSGSATCSVTGVTLTFAREDGVLTGHRVATGGGNITCTVNGSNSTANYITNDALDNLTFNGTTISYSFATTTGAWEMSGTIAGDNSMGGTATIRLGSTAGVFVLTGPWTATRN
jgi:hypothetical protein